MRIHTMVTLVRWVPTPSFPLWKGCAAPRNKVTNTEIRKRRPQSARKLSQSSGALFLCKSAYWWPYCAGRHTFPPGRPPELTQGREGRGVCCPARWGHQYGMSRHRPPSWFGLLAQAVVEPKSPCDPLKTALKGRSEPLLQSVHDLRGFLRPFVLGAEIGGLNSSRTSCIHHAHACASSSMNLLTSSAVFPSEKPST